jgi:hypothetical protein
MDLTIQNRIDETLGSREGIRHLVVEVLKEVRESGHDLGGMADYGKGWNDRGTQIRMIIDEIIERWKV